MSDQARSGALAALVGLWGPWGCAGGEDEGATTGSGGATTSGAGSTSEVSGGGATSGGGSGAESTSGATGETEAGSTGETGAATTMTGEPEPEVDPRLTALRTYAPRVWLHAEEAYFPSSVELAFASMTRFVGGDGKRWIRSTAALASPSDTLPFFAGDLAGAPVYAFYAEKGEGVVDLVYFFWYPYNRGKEVLDTIWGNHVGDWEHITVRLTEGRGGALTPAQVYLSAHSFGGAYAWGEVERFAETHPVVYAAWGSHGLWREPGDHVYMTIGEEVLGVCVTLVCADLVDRTGAGVRWDTWERVAGFDFAAQEGLGGEAWPAWMSEDFAAAGAGPPEVPGGGPIYRWGNPEDCSTLGVDLSELIGVCRLENGPTGPVSKGVWGPELQ